MEFGEKTVEAERKKLRKYKCCSICFLLTAVILVISSAFVPKLMNTALLFGAKKSSQLTPANEANWNGIPGANDIGIYWNQYFYNCTNALDVVYQNAKPEYQEFGPYVYRESDTYSDLDYQNLDNTISQEQLSAVFNTFTQGCKFESDDTGTIDTPMYLTNQAPFGVWYQQNLMGQQPDQQWRVYLTLIYSAVNDGLGRQVVQNGAWTQMRAKEFKDVSKINNIFVPSNPVTDAQANALYTDPWYGLVNFENYNHWDNLVYTTDPIKKQEQLVWMWELRTYFGLTNAQVLEMQTNWNAFYTDQSNIVMTTIPSVSPYLNQNGVAYWQWADSYITMYKQDQPQPSVYNATSTVTGYVEYWYWLQYYCNPDNQAQMSDANWAFFQDVQMYNSKSDITINFEHLFNLEDPVTGADPGPESLYNLTTLQTLVKLGQNTPNILYQQEIIYKTDFTLSSEWTDLGETLLFTDPSQEGTDIAAERAYMLYLWMNTTWDLTFEQAQNGGNFQIGVIGTLGATAFYETMTLMSMEFPMLLLAQQMSYNYYLQSSTGITCQAFYEIALTLSEDQAEALCSSSQNFTFADSFQTSVALSNVYLYQGAINSFYHTEFLAVTGMTDAELNSTLYDADSGFEQWFMNKMLPEIKMNVEGLGVYDGATLDHNYVSFSNLTYNQWLNGTILANPTSWQEQFGFANSTGYVTNYGKYATGWINPEYGFWKEMNNMPALPQISYHDAMDQTYYAFNTSGLYNGKKFQDELLYPQDQWSFLPKFEEYLRSMTINFGLSGLITVRSPREMIEGYTDPLVATLNETPIYMGGDNATSAFLALNNPPTHPTDNTVAFFTGTDEFEMTRQYGQWLSQEYVMIKGKEYTSVSEIQDYIYSPWEEKVLLDGTDGMQFSPDLQTDDVIAAFVNDLSRNCYFDYSHNDDTYPHLDNYIFVIQQALMQNMTENPANENYQVKVTGTTNMTTSLNAWGFAAKGHYYQLSEEASDSKPIIRDASGKEIETNPDVDDTYLGVEPLSGVCLQAMERIFFNFQIFGDNLFRNFNPPLPEEFGYFFPLAFIKRESTWQQSQVDEVFGPLVLGKKLTWVLFSLLLTIGLVFAGLTFLCGYKYHKLRKVLEESEEEVFGAESSKKHRGSGLNRELSQNQGLLDVDKHGTRTQSDDSFDDFRDNKNKPHMSQQERVFNLHGQGKPIMSSSQEY